MSYLTLNFIVIVAVLNADIFVFRTRVAWRRRTWLVGGWLMLATLVFDTFLTGLPIVTYNAHEILGVYAGSIPVEDFGYTLVLAIFIPMLWEVFKNADRR